LEAHFGEKVQFIFEVLRYI